NLVCKTQNHTGTHSVIGLNACFFLCAFGAHKCPYTFCTKKSSARRVLHFISLKQVSVGKKMSAISGDTQKNPRKNVEKLENALAFAGILWYAYEARERQMYLHGGQHGK